MRQFGLKAKLLLSFGLQLLFIAAIGAVGFTSLNRVTTTYTHVVEVNFVKEKLLSEFRLAQKDIVAAVRTLSANDLSDDTLDEQAKTIRDANEKFNIASEKYNKMAFVSGEKEIWDQIPANWTPLVDFGNKVLELARAGTPESYQARVDLVKRQFDGLRKKIRTPVESLRELQSNESEKWSRSAEDIARNAKTTMVISMIAGIVLGVMVAVYLTSQLIRVLTGITGRLTTEADELSKASKNISSSSEELSSRVSEQAAALQETSASVEQINSMIVKTAENAGRSRELSRSSQETVRNGQGLIQQLIAAIQDIDRSNIEVSGKIEEGNREIQEIVQVIANIGAKTQVINDIVFQTKLLSFNASVEAARAGEHGKGFAVVAEEVGNLASMSGNAAKEITGLLDGSIGKVETIVKNTKARVETLVQSSKGKVSVGTEIAGKCDLAFKEIVFKANEVSQLIEEIDSATQEQAQGVKEVSKAMSQLDQVTQQNSRTAQDSAQASVDLSRQANTVTEVVSDLLLTVQGGAAGARHPAEVQTLKKSAPIGRKLRSAA